MSIFTTISLAIVAYFAVGGLILGLIKYDFELVESIMFWPVIVIQYIYEVIYDLWEGVKEMKKEAKARWRV